MRRLNTILVLVLAILLISCNKDDESNKRDEEIQEPFEIKAFNIRFKEGTYGSEIENCCGILMSVTDTSNNSHSGTYAPISIPETIDTNNRITYNVSFTGKLKVYPQETIECKDCMADPLPGQEHPLNSYKKVEIIELQVK